MLAAELDHINATEAGIGHTSGERRTYTTINPGKTYETLRMGNHHNGTAHGAYHTPHPINGPPPRREETPSHATVMGAVNDHTIGHNPYLGESATMWPQEGGYRKRPQHHFALTMDTIGTKTVHKTPTGQGSLTTKMGGRYHVHQYRGRCMDLPYNKYGRPSSVSSNSCPYLTNWKACHPKWSSSSRML